jgi:hypothetical protein
MHGHMNVIFFFKLLSQMKGNSTTYSLKSSLFLFRVAIVFVRHRNKKSLAKHCLIRFEYFTAVTIKESSLLVCADVRFGT